MEYLYCVFFSYVYETNRKFGRAVVNTSALVTDFSQVVEMEEEVKKRAPETYTEITITNYILLREENTKVPGLRR